MSRHHQALHPSRWRLVRRAALKRAKWRCEDCGRAGAMEVHHLQPLRAGGDPYDLAGLIVLCRPCHLDTHRTRRRTLPGQDAWAAYIRELIHAA